MKARLFLTVLILSAFSVLLNAQDKAGTQVKRTPVPAAGIGEKKVDTSHISQIKKVVVSSGEVSQIKMNLRYAPVWIQ